MGRGRARQGWAIDRMGWDGSLDVGRCGEILGFWFLVFEFCGEEERREDERRLEGIIMSKCVSIFGTARSVY